MESNRDLDKEVQIGIKRAIEAGTNFLRTGPGEVIIEVPHGVSALATFRTPAALQLERELEAAFASSGAGFGQVLQGIVSAAKGMPALTVEDVTSSGTRLIRIAPRPEN